MAREAVTGDFFLTEEFSNLDERSLRYLQRNLRRRTKFVNGFARSPFVLLPNEVLFGEVDQVDHRLRGDEEMLVQHFNLGEQVETD